MLAPAPVPTLPGWRVEADAGSSGTLALAIDQTGTNIQFNWNIGTGSWVQARYDFAPALDLSSADIFGFTLRGDPNAAANQVTLMIADTNNVFYGYDMLAQNSGINQVNRWLYNLPVPRKAFYYFWGGSGPQTLNWSKIAKVFIVVKRPAVGHGGGFGTLWVGRSQFDTAANWPRQTVFESVAGGTALQNAASNAVNYLLSAQRPTGLLVSWLEEPSPTAWLYDQALAMIVLARAGLWVNRAPANPAAAACGHLAQFLLAAQYPDGHWARAWNPTSGAQLVDDGWVGDQAWCAMALSEYALRSGNATARTSASRAAERLAGLIQADGSIRGFSSTEGTVDVWWAMVANLRFGDSEKIRGYLLEPTRVWDPDLEYWWIGANNPLIACDCATWLSAFSRYPLVGVPQRGMAALSFVRRTLLTTSDDGNLCGFDGMGPVSVWNEGTAQFVAAGGQDAPSFLENLLAQQNLDGSMPGSPNNWSTDAFGWLSHWRGVAPTAWLFFAIKGLPFPESTRDTDGDGMADWAEFIAGTEPLDPTSFLAIQNTTSDDTLGTFSFSWQTVTNRFYTVLTSPTPGGAWSAVPGYSQLAGTGRALQFSTRLGTEPRFFRLAVQR